MYHRIRIAVVSLIVIAICALNSSVTISYFTDTEVVTNEFLVGNIATTLAVYSDSDGTTPFVASGYTLVDNMDIPYYAQMSNTGNIPVYQRFRVVFPAALDGVVTLNGLPCTLANNTCVGDNYSVTYNPSINGNAEYYIVSNTAVAVSSETIKWPFTGIHINDVPDEKESLFVCSGGPNSCVLGISVYSDAIQTVGFSGAASAFTSLTETY